MRIVSGSISSMPVLPQTKPSSCCVAVNSSLSEIDFLYWIDLLFVFIPRPKFDFAHKGYSVTSASSLLSSSRFLRHLLGGIHRPIYTLVFYRWHLQRGCYYSALATVLANSCRDWEPGRFLPEFRDLLRQHHSRNIIQGPFPISRPA
jgi:hypothetical protein